MKWSIRKLGILLLLCSLLLGACNNSANSEDNVELCKNVKIVAKMDSTDIAALEEQKNMYLINADDLRIVIAQYGSAQVPVSFYSKTRQAEVELKETTEIGRSKLATLKFYAYRPGEADFFKELTYDEMQKQPAIYEDDIRVMYSNLDEDFMAEVQMTSYSFQEQEMIPTEYKNHIEQLLLEKTANPPPVIIDCIWKVDMDGDGNVETIVSATNQYPKKYDPSSASVSDGVSGEYSNAELVDYHILSLFSETLSVEDLYEEINVTNLNDNHSIALSLAPFDAELASEAGNYYDLFQWSDSGEMILLPIYELMFYDGFGAFQIIICDINGDGLMDACTFVGELYPGFSVFIQNPDGSFGKPRTIYFPA